MVEKITSSSEILFDYREKKNSNEINSIKNDSRYIHIYIKFHASVSRFPFVWPKYERKKVNIKKKDWNFVTLTAAVPNDAFSEWLVTGTKTKPSISRDSIQLLPSNANSFFSFARKYIRAEKEETARKLKLEAKQNSKRGFLTRIKI